MECTLLVDEGDDIFVFRELKTCHSLNPIKTTKIIAFFDKLTHTIIRLWGRLHEPILKLSSNQNETFSTCSPIMSASFKVNWMTSSLIIYV